jgi:hypothetical protein
MENKRDCEICQTALFEGTICPGGSAASHFVLPINYFYNSQHKYFDSLNEIMDLFVEFSL